MIEISPLTKFEIATFFGGLDAGINSLREVRATYGAQIAFDFNSLALFDIGETKLSEIFAFILNPTSNHAQKDAFLRAFLTFFGLHESVDELLKSCESIEVNCEKQTDKGRRIDIVILFPKSHFAVGIEHKIYASDQPNQVIDYCNFLNQRTDGNYTLLYLSPKDRSPDEDSVDKLTLEDLWRAGKVRIVDYRRMVDFLQACEMVCRADNVRGFIRQLQQYLKSTFLGESFMGERNYMLNYVREHPEILKHADALTEAVRGVKSECFDHFWKQVAEELLPHAIVLDLALIKFCDYGYTQASVKRPGCPFEAGGELVGVTVLYEPNKIAPPAYMTISMKYERKYLPEPLRTKIQRLEEKVKSLNFGEISGYAGSWHCAVVPLPQINFRDGEEMFKILKDPNRTLLKERAKETATKIALYLNSSESFWREISV